MNGSASRWSAACLPRWRARTRSSTGARFDNTRAVRQRPAYNRLNRLIGESISGRNLKSSDQGGSAVRASAVQLNSNEDKARNLEIAERLVRRAAAEGAELIVLPEKFNVLGPPEQRVEGAEPLDGPTLRWAGGLAAELGTWLVAGSIMERVDGDDKLRTTSVLLDPEGVARAVYRKIHMFDVEVGGTTYSESDVE